MRHYPSSTTIRLGGYRPIVGLVLAPMDDVQRVVAADVAMALGVEDWTALRARLLAAERNRVWLAPPLLSVAAGLLTVVTASADASPWGFTDDLWDRYLPECKPAGRADWRKASFAVQAAGCLAAGVWLDVGVTESFWHAPFWPDVLHVVDLLRRVAGDLAELTWPELAEQVLELLVLPRPASSLD